MSSRLLQDLGGGPTPINPPAPAPPLPLEEPPVGIEHTFEVVWRLDGKVLAGEFTHRVPTQAERRQIGRIVAGALNGVPRASFGDGDLFQIERDAAIAVCFGPRVPPWFKLDDCLDPRLLDRLYEEGLAHTARFLGRSGDPRASEKASGGGDG